MIFVVVYLEPHTMDYMDTKALSGHTFTLIDRLKVPECCWNLHLESLIIQINK